MVAMASNHNWEADEEGSGLNDIVGYLVSVQTAWDATQDPATNKNNQETKTLLQILLCNRADP